MTDWVHSFGHCLVSHFLWQIASNSLMSSDPAFFKSSPGTLSTPEDLPAFSERNAFSTSSFIIALSAHPPICANATVEYVRFSAELVVVWFFAVLSPSCDNSCFFTKEAAAYVFNHS